MLALAIYRSERCPGCNGRLSETTDPENEGRYHATAIRCFKCTEMSVSAKTFQDPNVTAPNAILYVAALK